MRDSQARQQLARPSGQPGRQHRMALTGWGRTAPTVADVTEPAGLAEVPTLVTCGATPRA